jgi:tetratricopeptide (TPR) repeat protein
MSETDLQIGGGYTYQWECAILLALNYFFEPVRYDPTLFNLIRDFLGQVEEIHLEGEDRESGLDLEDINLVNGNRRILIQVKTKQAEGERWTPTDDLLLKALYRFYQSRFLTEQPDDTHFVFLTNRPFNPDLVQIRDAIKSGTLDQCAQVEKLCGHLSRYAHDHKGIFIDADRFRHMLEHTALVVYLPVDAVKANVQAKLQAYGRRDWQQAQAVLFEHFARQSTRVGGGVVTRDSVDEVLGRLSSRPSQARARRTRRIAALAAVGLVLITLGVGIAGPWRSALIGAIQPASISSEWPTPTPLVSLPLSVALICEGCEDDRGIVEEAITHGGGEVVEEGAQMQVEVTCMGDQMTIAAHFPDEPAYPIEFLDDAPVLSVETEVAYGRAFVVAAVAYASGDYSETVKSLEQTVRFLPDPDAHLLLAQALLHLERWEDARAAYTAALEGWPQAETAQRARAYAGRGLTRIFRMQMYEDNTDAQEDCETYAASDFEAAMAAEPDRVLWPAGRVTALLACPGGEPDTDAILRDIESAVEQAEGIGGVDQATVLATAASVYKGKDAAQARLMAQRAISITDELPTPHCVMISVYGRDELDKAMEAYERCWERHALPWKRQSLELLLQFELDQLPQ